MDATPDEFRAPPPLPSPPLIGLPPALAGPGAGGPSIGQALGLLLLYFVLQVAVGGVAGVFVGIAFGFQHHGATSGQAAAAALSRPDFMTIAVIVSVMVAACIMFWAVHRLWPRLWSQPRVPGLGFTRPSHAGFYGLAAITGLLMPFLGDLLTLWLARGHAVPQDIRQLGGSASQLLRVPLAALVVGVGPLTEELLFRGVLLSALTTPRPPCRGSAQAAWWQGPARRYQRIRLRLADRLGHWPAGGMQRGRTVAAVLTSALIFGLVHLPGLHFLWYAVPNLVLLGIALAWLRLRSQSIWPPVIAHGMNNLLAVMAWFFTMHPPG